MLGLSAATGVACASQSSRASASQAGRLTGAPPQGGHLVLDYKPSQVTGWSLPYSPTLGGHAASSDFSWNGKPYRVSLLPFGQSGAPHPLYEGVPSDPTVKFKHTLATAWGAYYTFRYLGGLDRGATFTVESYGAWHGKPLNMRLTGVAIGADLYFVYHPGSSEHIPPSTATCSSSRSSTTR